MQGWVLTVAVAAAPAVFLLSFFYIKDRYEREPILHLFAAFGLGAFAMLAARGIGGAALGLLPDDWLQTASEPARLVDAFLLSHCVEEPEPDLDVVSMCKTRVLSAWACSS